MLYISLSTGRSATRFWRKCIYVNAVMLISRLRSFSLRLVDQAPMFCCWYNANMCVTEKYASHSMEGHHAVARNTVPHAVFLELLPGAATCVLGVLEGWNFLCIVTPPWGADNQNFKKKIGEQKIFLVLLVPLTFRCITHVLRALRVWNLLCVVTPSCGTKYHIFVYKFVENWSFFQLFQTKNPFLRDLPLLRLITSVIMVLGVWNLLCVFTLSRGTE